MGISWYAPGIVETPDLERWSFYDSNEEVLTYRHSCPFNQSEDRRCDLQPLHVTHARNQCAFPHPQLDTKGERVMRRMHNARTSPGMLIRTCHAKAPPAT